MSAGKLSRFTGLVFVLAAFIGGAGADHLGAEHETGGSTIWTDGGAADTAAGALAEGITYLPAEFDWT